MTTLYLDNFDLRQIAESGQCFRWQRLDEKGNKYKIIAGSSLVIAQQQPEEDLFTFYCDQDEFDCIWADYFDYINPDYRKILAEMKEKGGLLKEAAAAGAGIRILRQDPWEMLITFLTAQNINIPRATTLIERLCSKYGQEKQAGDTKYMTFPSPERLAVAKPEDLRQLGFGYRDKQIITAAQVVASGAVDLDKLKRLDHDTAKLVLKNMHGVGDKVAECISLFGLGKLESYPVDTWVQKIEDYFGRGYIQSEFPDHAGVVQQYLFAYVRRYGLPERGNT